jgi:hypothetical protein
LLLLSILPFSRSLFFILSLFRTQHTSHHNTHTQIHLRAMSHSSALFSPPPSLFSPPRPIPLQSDDATSAPPSAFPSSLPPLLPSFEDPGRSPSDRGSLSSHTPTSSSAPTRSTHSPLDALSRSGLAPSIRSPTLTLTPPSTASWPLLLLPPSRPLHPTALYLPSPRRRPLPPRRRCRLLLPLPRSPLWSPPPRSLPTLILLVADDRRSTLSSVSERRLRQPSAYSL